MTLTAVKFSLVKERKTEVLHAVMAKDMHLFIATYIIFIAIGVGKSFSYIKCRVAKKSKFCQTVWRSLQRTSFHSFCIKLKKTPSFV